ncbi:TetR/AcrR family transcriptional regulator [Paractinoplanes atraurantiacus]|uniref:DNA-binding transcriptional regulator, AcrR family n=1 Tax=Paractinoplanes atraurantiacus TaxID=1036182 RepID=A0A285F3I3_9ACTN|nr:TetR/AcrR family transcriptional regulator [Actinoplanes atraurantiacus]SNY05838.1 DNA-binding transcriptional regulator, AcrR family [Actinoplanes atraurantiacus]
MPRVSEEHLNARRQQILEAARACFVTKGLHNTSMQDLIKEAGLSVGAVYRYFKSKDEIIAAIAETVTSGILQHIHAVAARRLPLAESMEAVLEAIEAQMGPGGTLPIALQVWAEASIDPAIAAIAHERYTTLRKALQVLVEHAVESGELPAGTDVEAVTSAYYSFVPGYALQRLLTGGPDKEIYMRGIRELINR